ncbi:NfeD family protein [Naasia lichenicola]|uniref:NfeD family protein n=1 Tax=Naasia lichenicola TaxID=2565933 RepID=A0A4S4FRV8_9MICO|nr:NfeD family protein [Naasia lichenicola]THG33409.1 NfeD family protein [Naasia lichenicola]
MMPDLVQYMWIVWLVFIVICVIIEVITLEFTFLMIAIGSLGGLGTQLAGGPWWLQIIVAFLFALLLLFVVRPILLRATRKGADLTPTNLDALSGMAGRVVIELGEHGGQVKLANGETWTALLVQGHDAVPLPIGARVTVASISGSTAHVLPVPVASAPPPDPSGPVTPDVVAPTAAAPNPVNPNESSATS